MKLSLNWLNSYFTAIPNWDEVLHKLTMAGLEVEGIETIDNDRIVEFKITPNRGDALSVKGILREITALADCTVIKSAQEPEFKSTIPDKMQIELSAPEACPNYLALIIKNINQQAVLPSKISTRLNSSGFRSISPVVDITNYVMLELGQPLHAFDLNKVGDKLSVRFARSGENLRLLADVDAKLTANTLLICDSNDKPAAIAGVMGGAYSGVSGATTDIVLESAFFIPDVIAGLARYYGIASDSAYRFERGVDPQLQEVALRYAASLIAQYCGGEIGQIAGGITQYKAKLLKVSYAAVDRLIGINIPRHNIHNTLAKLGFIVGNTDDNTITVTVPGHRFDVTIKEDIIEEVARVYGYDNIEAQMPIVSYTMSNNRSHSEQALKVSLVSLGYSEIIGYAFVPDNLESLLGNADFTPVQLQNPIANLNVMRTSLLADLVKTLQRNLNHGHKRLRIFELARVFHGETKDLQPLKVAGLAYGNYTHPNWSSNNRLVDFYDLRHDIEVLLSGLGKVKFVVCRDNPLFHSGRCAKILLCDKHIGVLGQLHPKYKTEFDLAELPYIFELDVNFILTQTREMVVNEVSRFQKVERDLAFLIEVCVNAGDVLDVILNANIPHLINANIFDVYQGEKLANVKLNGNSVKSVAINFLFQGNKTLTEEEINISMAEIQQCMQANFTMQLRI